MGSTNIYELMERIETVLYKTGSLSVAQAEAINEGNALSKGAVRQLVKESRAFYSRDRDFILANPKYKPRAYMEDAVSAMLPFIGQIHLKNIFIPCEESNDAKKKNTSPIIFGFTRGQKVYEVCRAKDSKELKSLIPKLEKIYQTDKEELENIRYLIALPRESTMNYMDKNVSFPYAFACVKYDSKRNADVSFYSSDKITLDELNEGNAD